MMSKSSPHKELEVVNNRDMPDITVQHLLAVMLLDGTLTFATAHDYKRIKDPRVLKLRRSCIETIGDPSLTDPNPERRCWRCAMEVTLKDGRKLTHQTMAARGGLENPLTRQEVEQKAHDLMAPILGIKRSRALISALFTIESIKDARALRRLYAV
jgi:MmgE/PrpD C-terminal domain